LGARQAVFGLPYQKIGLPYQKSVSKIGNSQKIGLEKSESVFLVKNRSSKNGLPYQK